MADLNLHETMIERAAEVLEEMADSGTSSHDVARGMIEAAFEGVPFNNYAMGTLLQDFDLVIVVKDLDSRAAALVARRDGERRPEEGFETLGHDLIVDWKQSPARHISGVRVHKLDPPES